MHKLPSIFSERRDYCEERLSEFRSNVENIENITEIPDLCIYVTGSYGRLEASSHSDLDLFFVKKGASEIPVPKTEKILLDAELIKITRKMGFLEFSGFGQYLEIHYLEDVLTHLGSPRDDYDNLFAARLCLLLESQPIYNYDAYKDIISTNFDTYYRDYHDHEIDFMPIFLVNDIIDSRKHYV